MSIKRNNMNNIRAIAITVVVLLIYIVLLLGPESIKQTRVNYSTNALPEITRDSVITEEIYSGKNGFNSLALMHGTFGRVNYSTLNLTLADQDNQIVGSWSVDCSCLEDNAYATYYLDAPLDNSAQKTYILTITSDADVGNGVTVFTCGDNILYRVGNAKTTFDNVFTVVLSIVFFAGVPFVFWKSRNNYWGLAYAAYILLVILMHFYMPTNTQDDLFMSRANDGYTAMSWAVWKWNTWSSRFLQEFFGFIVVNRPMLWKTIDTTMFALMPYLINRSLHLTRYERLFSLGTLPLYPILDQISAGWMCTTMTYIWPVFFALVTTAILRDIMDGRRIRWFEYPVFFFSLIYASNHELMAIYLLGILIYCAIVSRKEYKSKKVFVLSSVAVSILNFVVIMLCPGTKIRGEDEAAIHFGNYVGYNAFDKLFLGINRCLDIFVSRMNAAFIVLSIVIAVGVFVKTSTTWKRLVSLFPVISWFAIHAMFITPLTEEFMWLHYFTARALMLLVFAFVLLGSLVFSIFEIYRGEKVFTNQGILVALILMLGMATTVAMGFSPTVYASATRTSTFTYYGIIVVITALLSKICADKKIAEKSIVPVSILCFVVLMGIRVMNVIGLTLV